MHKRIPLKNRTPDRFASLKSFRGFVSEDFGAEMTELWGRKKSEFISETLDLKIPFKDKMSILTYFLSYNTLLSLACDFTEYVLPLFERMYPEERCVRKAIEFQRRVVKGKGNSISDVCNTFEKTYYFKSSSKSAKFVALSAAYLCSDFDAQEKFLAAFDNALKAVRNKKEMMEWMTKRIKQYLN